jgi:hypothetical protein
MGKPRETQHLMRLRRITMPTPVNRFLRAGRRSATRQATPLCAVAAVASMTAGLPTGVTLALGGLAVVSYVLRPAPTVQI